MKRLCPCLLAATILSVPALVAAETVYVTDQVAVALRADVTPGAAVVKTVATGAVLELLERSGSFAKVRDSDGIEGWIETTALAVQPPAAVQLKALRAELERTRAQLVNAQMQLDKARSAPKTSPEVEQLAAELAAARAQLADAQAELKKQAESRAAVASARPEPAPEPATAAGFSFLWLGIAFAMLAIGFVGGIVWVRESIRRRMGGMYLRI